MNGKADQRAVSKAFQLLAAGESQLGRPFDASKLCHQYLSGTLSAYVKRPWQRPAVNFSISTSLGSDYFGASAMLAWGNSRLQPTVRLPSPQVPLRAPQHGLRESFLLALTLT